MLLSSGDQAFTLRKEQQRNDAGAGLDTRGKNQLGAFSLCALSVGAKIFSKRC